MFGTGTLVPRLTLQHTNDLQRTAETQQSAFETTRGEFTKEAKGSENVCTIEAQTGTCLCVQ